MSKKIVAAKHNTNLKFKISLSSTIKSLLSCQKINKINNQYMNLGELNIVNLRVSKSSSNVPCNDPNTRHLSSKTLPGIILITFSIETLLKNINIPIIKINKIVKYLLFEEYDNLITKNLKIG